MCYLLRIFVAASLLLALTAHGQTGTGCEAVLLKQDTEYYKQDTNLRYHFANAVDEATYKRLQQEVGVDYAGFGVDYSNVQNERNSLRQRSTGDFSQQESWTLLKMRASEQAINAFAQCIQFSSENGFFDAIVTGDPKGTVFNVKIIWKPQQQDGNRPIEHIDSNLIQNIPSSIPRGQTTFQIIRKDASQELVGYM